MDEPVPQRKATAPLTIKLPTAAPHTSVPTNNSSGAWSTMTKNSPMPLPVPVPVRVSLPIEPATSASRTSTNANITGPTPRCAWDSPPAVAQPVKSAWGAKKNLFPDAPPPVAPPAELLKSLSIANKVDTESTEFAEHDPDSPRVRFSVHVHLFLPSLCCSTSPTTRVSLRYISFTDIIVYSSRCSSTTLNSLESTSVLIKAAREYYVFK